MKVILRQEVPKLGKAGEVRSVADGYARNFLFPRGLAELATESNLRSLDRRHVEYEVEETMEKAHYRTLAGRLQTAKLSFTIKIGEKGQAFGSVTVQDVINALAEQGIHIEKAWIELAHGIKSTGEHIVRLNLPHHIAGQLTIVITPSKS